MANSLYILRFKHRPYVYTKGFKEYCLHAWGNYLRRFCFKILYSIEPFNSPNGGFGEDPNEKDQSGSDWGY